MRERLIMSAASACPSVKSWHGCFVDVCDDNDYAARAKADYHEKAKAAGVPAITSGGIYPGVSNVMAAHMVSTARREYDTEGHFVGKDGANKSEAVQPKKLQYFYYTAGTGELCITPFMCDCLSVCLSVCLLVCLAACPLTLLSGTLSVNAAFPGV